MNSTNQEKSTYDFLFVVAHDPMMMIIKINDYDGGWLVL